MIGSISKIRPCGHHHYYKYSHAKRGNDVKITIPNYRQDISSDGTWEYTFDDMTITEYYQDSVFYKWTELKNWDNKAPNLTWNSHAFSNSSNLTNFNLTWKGTAAHAVPGIAINNINCYRVFNLKYPNATDISYGLASFTAAENSIFRVYAPKATNASYFFTNDASNKRITIEFDTKTIKSGDALVRSLGSAPYINSLKFPIDEDGVHTFISGKEQVGYAYSIFPNLTSGTEMFRGCDLTKEYATVVLNSIPDWSSDTATEHKLTMGICADYAYDTELNLLLKKTDMNYITPIENVGGVLEEEVTSDKGWDLTVEWNYATSEEQPSAYINSLLEYDTVILPDGYTRCEYLEDTGSQYIITDYVPTVSTGLYIIAKNITGGNYIAMGCGQNISTTPNTKNPAFNAPRWMNRYNCGYNYGNWNLWNNSGSGTIYEGWNNYKNDKKARILTQGNEYNANLDTSINFGTERDAAIHLFGNSANGTAHTLAWMGRIYRAQITEGEEIVRDFIPCLNSEGIPCMYDIIEGKDYLNKVTTPFLYKIAEL